MGLECTNPELFLIGGIEYVDVVLQAVVADEARVPGVVSGIVGARVPIAAGGDIAY